MIIVPITSQESLNDFYMRPPKPVPKNAVALISDGLAVPNGLRVPTRRVKSLSKGLLDFLYSSECREEQFVTICLPGFLCEADEFSCSAIPVLTANPRQAYYAKTGSSSDPAILLDSELRSAFPLPMGIMVFRMSILRQMEGLSPGLESVPEAMAEAAKRFSAHFPAAVESHLPKQPQGGPKGSYCPIFDDLFEDFCSYYKVGDMRELVVPNLVLENAKKFSDMIQGKNMDSSEADEEVRKFYSSTESYVWELAGWHYSRFWDGWWTLSRHISGSFLEYGGGIGTMSFFAKESGASKISYFDVSPAMTAFFEHRAKSRGLAASVVPMADVPFSSIVSSITEEYDTICAIDVIEHIREWEPAVRHLVSKIRPGGTLIQHTNFGRGEFHPMHYNSSTGISPLLSSLGMRCIVDDYQGYKDVVWRK